ncbi:hypothetical protein LCGC14_1164900 [marine sediment metagenome]|uniref:Uncharacterized protein n=1 Tax=marine sediment metagenome TaxID=412755 RepID=A0A0F9PX23_9ZZZZ
MALRYMLEKGSNEMSEGSDSRVSVTITGEDADKLRGLSESSMISVPSLVRIAVNNLLEQDSFVVPVGTPSTEPREVHPDTPDSLPT